MSVLETSPDAFSKKALFFSVYLLFFSVFSSASGIGAGTALVVLFAAMTLRGRLSQAIRLPIVGSFLLFALAIVISVIFNDVPGTHFGKAVWKLRYFVVSFILATCFLWLPVLRSRILRASAVLGILLGTIAVLQFFGLFDPVWALHLISIPLSVIPESNGHYFHARGLLYHHNPFAFGVLLLFYLNLGQVMQGGNRKGHLLHQIGCVFCLLGILASCSRGAWVALIISGFTLSMVLGRRSLRVVVAILAAAVLIGLGLGSAVQKRFHDMGPSHNHERLRLWTISWHMFEESPWIGHGYHESFATQREKFMTPQEHANSHFPTDPHSVYFDLLGTTGLFGFLTFIYFLYSVLCSYWRVLRGPGLSGQDRGILIAAWGAFVCFIVGGAFDSHLYHTETLSVMLFGLAIGQGVVLATRQHRETAIRFSSPTTISGHGEPVPVC